LNITSGGDLTVEGYADANDRRSTTGWIFTIGGSPVSWRTAKQKAVTLSSTEAEYMAAADTAKEAIWLRDLLQELRLGRNQPPVIHQDNQGAIFLENNASLKRNTKHIDVKAHFIRERVKAGDIVIHYCPTDDMIADIFTKPLNKTKFAKHRESVLANKIVDESPTRRSVNNTDVSTSHTHF
jgi:hypothetical protein